jgi:hypothetical protein
MLGIDATLKLNKINYPLLVMCPQDLQHHTFPLAFALMSTQECGDVFSFCLNAFRKGYEKVFKEDYYSPTCIISDGSRGISSAWKKHFPEAVHIICLSILRKCEKTNATERKFVTG